MRSLVFTSLALAACAAPAKQPVAAPQAPVSQAPAPSEAPSTTAAAEPAAPTDFVNVTDSLGILSHEDSQAFPGCSYVTAVPELVGLTNKALERNMNARLEQLAIGELRNFCDDAPAQSELPDWSASRSYAVGAVRAPFVSLRFDDDRFSGGARGSHATACYLLDTGSGNVFSIGETLSDASLQQLSELYNQVKRADPSIRALESAGAQTADLIVTTSSTLCVKEGGLELQTADYELGGHAFGRPSFTISADQARPLFDVRLGSRLFPR